MKLYIFAILLFIPSILHAEIPAMVKLGEDASKQTNVEHMSVNRFMLGMASTFANKQQRETFKMLDNIEMIECKNSNYAPRLIERTMEIIKDVGAEHIGNHNDDKALNKLYAIRQGEVINELIIIVEAHAGGVAVVAMSGKIPINRLPEIATIKQ